MLLTAIADNKIFKKYILSLVQFIVVSGQFWNSGGEKRVLSGSLSRPIAALRQ